MNQQRSIAKYLAIEKKRYRYGTVHGIATSPSVKPTEYLLPFPHFLTASLSLFSSSLCPQFIAFIFVIAATANRSNFGAISD